MTSNRLSKKAREYMRAHPGVKYQQALDILASKTSEEPGTSQQLDVQKWLTGVGIANPSVYRPEEVWKRFHEEDSPTFKFPLGVRVDSETFEPVNTGDIDTDAVHLDLSEPAEGGYGPHGLIQGITGTGKSFLLESITASCSVVFSPDYLQFVLLDFKGGFTFENVRDLPNVVGTVSEVDSLERVTAVNEALRQELMRREILLADNRIKDIRQWTASHRREPDKYPPLPHLVVLVDEAREFFMSNPQQKTDILVRLGAVGRSLGMHVIFSSQSIDPAWLGEILMHTTFGISFTSNDEGRSRTVVGDSSAALLPVGTGIGVMRYSKFGLDQELVTFRAFDLTRSGDFQKVITTLKSITPDDSGMGELAQNLAVAAELN